MEMTAGLSVLSSQSRALVRGGRPVYLRTHHRLHTVQPTGVTSLPGWSERVGRCSWVGGDRPPGPPQRPKRRYHCAAIQIVRTCT